MRLQIDTNAKTIKVEQTVKIKELISAIKKLLPEEWEDYSLETGTVIYWPSYPVIRYDSIPYVNPIWKWPEVTCSSKTVSAGTYYCEIN